MGQNRASPTAGRLTAGVEEEFLLVDPVTRCTVPSAAAVLAGAGDEPSRAAGAVVHPELQGTQVEAATGVCVDLAELGAQVLEGRRRLAAAAEKAGVRLVSSGTPVLTETLVPVTASKRFEAIADLYAGAMACYQACGCHVHVGVEDRELAVAVVNHLRPWLATLLALSVNSPFDHARDSGYGSFRMMELARFPGAGVPPWFGSAAAYRRHVERLVDCGLLVDDRMTFWLARPSRRWPTVEVRAADAAATVDEAMLQAALARGLVRTALAELAAGREAARVDGAICAAAVWSAARYGLDGPAVHPFHEIAVPATRLLTELLDHIRPALAETGDLAAVGALLASVARRGSGAARQRRWAVSGPRAVVDGLVRQTLQDRSMGAR